jgi:hypothetical protein
MVFDVLSVEGESVMAKPYWDRRLILEDLQLDDLRWRAPEAFDDGGVSLTKATRATGTRRSGHSLSVSGAWWLESWRSACTSSDR